MPLPLLWIGAGLVGAALTAEHVKEKAQQLSDEEERERLRSTEAESYQVGDESSTKLPSDVLISSIRVRPVPGAVVCCSVFTAFDHTGIWIDDDLIIELHGSGLIKGVSVNRFLENRSGKSVYVACNSLAEPLILPGTVERATDLLMSYWDYDVLDNNCFRFTWQCVSGASERVAGFSGFNDLLAQLHQKKIYWDKLDVDQ